MKIPNYDIKSGEEDDKRVVNWLKTDCRILVAGNSGCGKTNLITHILRAPLLYYDQIYLYTPNHHQDKVQDLKKLMEDISKKVGYDVLEIRGTDSVLNTNEYGDDGNRKLIIFDDMINCSKKTLNRVANHWTDGRHHGVSCIFITQSYGDTPLKIRLNCCYMCLYPPSTRANLRWIAKENFFDPQKFDELKDFEFLFVDKQNNTVRKNFI